jgi:MFS family permease
MAALLSGFAYFFNGVDTLYFRHFELTFEQISFLVSANLIATLLCEVPTGAFADLYGKKRSIVAGSCVGLGGLAFLAFGSTFAAFTAGFMLLGVGRAFRSGADSALLFDVLRATGSQGDYIKHQSRIQALFVAIDIISGSLGFILYGLNVRIPFYISVVSMLLVILVQWSLPDIVGQVAQRSRALAAAFQQIRQGLTITIGNTTILWYAAFMLLYFIVDSFFGGVLNLPFLQEVKGFSNQQLAIMGFVWNLIQTVIAFSAGRIERRLGKNRSILAIVVLTPSLLLALLLSNNYLLSAIILGLYFGAFSFRDVVVDSYLNTHIDDDHRATVLSVNSMLASGAAIVVLPLLGRVIDTSGLASTLALLVAITFVLGGLCALSRRRMADAS